MDSSIIIEDVNVHPHSGHISLKVKTVTSHEGNSWHGPVRTYGVDAALFHGRFGGDVQQVVAWVKSQHTAYNGAHTDLVAALELLKGQTL